MKIEKNAVVTMTCELKKTDINGELIDSYDNNEPLKFLMGANNIFEAFENQITGLSKGENFDFVIQAADAFGEYDENGLVSLPYDTIMTSNAEQTGELEVGHPIKVIDQNDTELVGEVKEINKDENTVMVDFNHPLSGLNIHFSGQIIEVRNATEEEIEHGHTH